MRAVDHVMLVLSALAMAGALAFGCYTYPPVNPPSCAQDPTQEWCVPPAFARAPDGGVKDGGR